MAARATTATPLIEAPRRRVWGRHAREQVAAYALSAPAVGVLLVFFLLPIYFIVRYSIGVDRFALTEAAAELTGELAGFSLELWRDFLGEGAELALLGKSSLALHLPMYVVGIVFVALVLGAVFGKRVSTRFGGYVVGGSFFLLLAPFLTIPAGNNLLRLAELESNGDFLRLFFRSVTMATTSSV